MFVSIWFITGLVAIASATTLHADDEVFAALLKRQAPGTPSYNCHDNCGTAIQLSRQPNKCDIEAFKANYNNCLQCAGPDNFNIWNMYGRTLGSAGASCGLKTEPLSGKQPDVGPAVHTGGSSTTGSAAASATPAPASRSIGSAPTTSIPAPLSAVSSRATVVPSVSKNATVSFTSASTPPQRSTNFGAHVAVTDAAGVLGAVVAAVMAVL
ncbi:hypothetical protein GQ44DRAFT_705971 [Phaeosphaeriaceae sp. PMI808]|nr:hypothetical protein GQ44DRAFT_705971 [Phaeosphaeriaceae sp. PMI808]